jgi:proteasome lid subunit RPN8/RPN11
MYRIKKEALEFMLGVSRSLYPREFIGFLRAEGKTITEVIVLPGSIYGRGFGSVQDYMLPADKTIVGSVHSHPSQSNMPSRGDLHFFNKKGGVNVIIKYPYQTIDDLMAYDNAGNPVEVKEA